MGRRKIFDLRTDIKEGKEISLQRSKSWQKPYQPLGNLFLKLPHDLASTSDTRQHKTEHFLPRSFDVTVTNLTEFNILQSEEH